MGYEFPRRLLGYSQFAIFSVSGLKDEKLIKSKPTWKLKHTNTILDSFEYFCQISSKLILAILSYTVSKLVRWFLRHSVDLRDAIIHNHINWNNPIFIMESIHTCPISLCSTCQYHLCHSHK